jgi:RNA polymerase primary sigma factor
MGEEIREGKVVISTIVDGFSNPNEADDYVAEEDFDEFDEADDDDGKGGSKAMTRLLEKLKTDALERFDRMGVLFEKLRKAYDKDGWGSPTYVKVQKSITEELNKTQREALKKFEGTLKEENYEKRKGFFKKLKDMFNN